MTIYIFEFNGKNPILRMDEEQRPKRFYIVSQMTSAKSFISVICPWHHEGGNLFSKYYRSNWLFYVGYYLEVSSSLQYGQ